MTDFHLRLLESSDRGWVSSFVEEHWGSRRVVSRGVVHYPEELDGFVALRGGQPVGLATFRIERAECEVVTLNSLAEGRGIGSSLLNAVKGEALSAGCKRLWLITTNDNLAALRFYQKWGFRLVAVYPNALEQSRRLKPEIPLVGKDGIPLRDELELEIILNPGSSNQ